MAGWLSCQNRAAQNCGQTGGWSEGVYRGQPFGCQLFVQNFSGCKFGRVVKAVALGAILVRGRGSNPLACTNFCFDQL